MDAAAIHGARLLRSRAALLAFGVAALAMIVAGADGQWEWPSAPVQPGSAVPLAASISTDRAGLPLEVPGTIYPEIGDSARKSNALRVDMHNLQTSLDALYHPGVTVTMESIVVAAATGRVRELGGSLTEAEMRAVLAEAGWPRELHEAALAVAWCESRWSPYAHGDGGASLGLFQLNVETWFRYAGEDPAQWADPVVSARVAWATYQYDLGRGYEPWRQWSCKP